MTQTIEQRARELLAKHYELSGTHHYANQLRNGHQDQPQAIAALTEALARIEELEGALGFYAEEKNWRSPSSGFALQYDPEPSPINKDRGNLARTTPSKGITE